MGKICKESCKCHMIESKLYHGRDFVNDRNHYEKLYYFLSFFKFEDL